MAKKRQSKTKPPLTFEALIGDEKELKYAKIRFCTLLAEYLCGPETGMNMVLGAIYEKDASRWKLLRECFGIEPIDNIVTANDKIRKIISLWFTTKQQ